ncbi:MAG: hypothetical protein WKF31_12340 [Thermoleophilaceae bacterium]
MRRELGGPDFHRVRVGVGRPDSTDPEIVASYVLGRFSEPADEVRGLIERAADEVEHTLDGGSPGTERSCPRWPSSRPRSSREERPPLRSPPVSARPPAGYESLRWPRPTVPPPPPPAR